MTTDHRVTIADGWSLWRWARLRGAGFPARKILGLAAVAAAEAADLLLDAERDAEQVRARVLTALRDVQRASAGRDRTVIGNAMKRVRSRRPVDALAILGESELARLVEPLIQLESTLTAAEVASWLRYTEAAREWGAVLRQVVREPQFREAVLWQNRHAVTTGCASLVRHEGKDNARTRKQEKLVASYLQRYCTKNDTIGFFGPNGWGRIDETRAAIEVRPGPTMLASRTVYFEYWAIDALASRIARDPELKPQLAPRRLPTTWLDGTTLHHPIDRTTELPEVFARLVAWCDGDRTAAEVAKLAVAEPALGFEDADEVYDLLGELVDRGLLTWTIEIPTTTARPERYLRTVLERAGTAGERGLAMLDELERGRAAITRAAGDPDALDAALGALEATFEQLTDATATRAAGQTYAGRTLVYEDCRRDLDLVLGAGFLQRLGAPLALVLQSARWYTFQIADRYAHAFRRIYNEERAAIGDTVVDYVRFWHRARELFPGREGGGIVEDVARELQSRWSRILGLEAPEPDGALRRIERTVAELRGVVAEAFAAPHPGWPSARHHSPDVLIGAATGEAFARGDYLIVLGEVHVGMNTAAVQVALEQHPDPALLIAAREADLPHPGIAPTWSKARTRADFYSPSTRDFDVETGETRSSRPRDHVLAMGALVIEDRGGALVVRSRDGGPSFDLIPFLEQHLIAESFSHFEITSRRPHTPRVVVDGVVFARERWRFACDALPFAKEPTPAKRFLEVRRWARSHGMPRLVFAKTDAEIKPIFVDFDSPVLVDILLGDLAGAREVSVTEMLPAIDECWLQDAAGNTYTSELRMVATDPEPWAARSAAEDAAPLSPEPAARVLRAESGL